MWGQLKPGDLVLSARAQLYPSPLPMVPLEVWGGGGGHGCIEAPRCSPQAAHFVLRACVVLGEGCR